MGLLQDSQTDTRHRAPTAQIPTSGAMHRATNSRLVPAAVVALTLAGLGLRIFTAGHGLPYQYVPDESTMVGGALRMGANRSPQPGTFIYPALLMYLFAAEYLGLLVVGRLTGLFASIEQFKEYAFIDPTLFYLLPRLAIALAGTATIPMAYLLAKRLYGRWAGVAAAALVTVSVMHVQMSQQARHWVPVSLLGLLVLWKSLDLVERGARRDYWISGLLVGITAATSFNGFLMMALPVAAHWVRLRRTGGRLLSVKNHIRMLQCLVLAPAIFFALNPFILLQFGSFLAFHSSGESSIGGQIRGHYANYLQQFLEKQGFGFYAWSTLAYEPAITLLGIVGAIISIRRFPSTAFLVLLYPLFHYFMFATTAPSMEQRYMLPAVVMWALPAGLAVQRAGSWLLARGGASRTARIVVVGGAIGLLFLASLPALRYDWLLAQPDTRTLAKEWIETSIPADEEIAVESYPPPLNPNLETLRAQQQAAPRSLGNRDQWILEKGIPAGEVAYDLVRLNLVDTSPREDNLSPYLETHHHHYFVVSDYRWKSEHKGHLALKDYLARNGRLVQAFYPSPDTGYLPSDMLNNMEDPLVELWRIERPGPAILIYEIPR